MLYEIFTYMMSGPLWVYIVALVINLIVAGISRWYALKYVEWPAGWAIYVLNATFIIGWLLVGQIVRLIF